VDLRVAAAEYADSGFESLGTLRQRLRLGSRDLLDRYAIALGNGEVPFWMMSGEQVVLSDTIVGGKEASIMLSGAATEHTVSLQSATASGESECGPLSTSGDSCLLRVSITDPDGEVEVLHDDGELPEWRYSAFGYWIEEIYRYDDMIAIFIAVGTAGFEGPDYRHMVVTAVRAEPASEISGRDGRKWFGSELYEPAPDT
jgi:hypothetical protein